MLTVYFYCNKDTPVYMCFLDAKRHLIALSWTLAKKLSSRNVQLHIAKLFIFGYWEQVFLVRCGNSLPMTFCCPNGIRQGGWLSLLLYNVYTDDLNHLHEATGVGCYVGGAWVNSLSYPDDMVLLAPRLSALHTIWEVCLAHAGPRGIECNATITVLSVQRIATCKQY